MHTRRLFRPRSAPLTHTQHLRYIARMETLCCGTGGIEELRRSLCVFFPVCARHPSRYGSDHITLRPPADRTRMLRAMGCCASPSAKAPSAGARFSPLLRGPSLSPNVSRARTSRFFAAQAKSGAHHALARLVLGNQEGEVSVEEERREEDHRRRAQPLRDLGPLFREKARALTSLAGSHFPPPCRSTRNGSSRSPAS